MAPSPPMLEVILLHVDGSDLKAQAVHNAETPDSPWIIMLAPVDADFWLVWTETQDLKPFSGGLEFDENATSVLIRMAILFGDSWTDLLDDFDGLLETQRTVLDRVTENFVGNVVRHEIDELSDWRQTMEKDPPQAGELMRQDMLGIKPIQGRN